MPNEFDLGAARKKFVVKDNRIIQKSRYACSALEQKALSYMLSKVKKGDEPGKIYVFSCKEFQTLLKWNKAASYQNIKNMLQNLGDMSIWVKDDVNGRPKEILLRWFHIVRIDAGSGDIEISFHEDMFPYILNLSGNYYTKYQIQSISLMKHKYSIRIFELLKSYQLNNQKWTFENGTGSEFDIQLKIADTIIDKKSRKPVSVIPEGWSNWAVFKRNVLDKAVEEINKYTDMKVGYVGKKEDLSHRKTRAVRTIKFFMAEKTDPEQRETEQIIDAAYSVSEEKKNSQDVIEKAEMEFFAKHEKSLELEQEEKAYFKRLRKEQAAERAKYKILYEEINEMRKANFDEKKLSVLYSAAIKERTPGNVSRENWEMFAVDLITHYYDKIISDAESTRSSIYNRLLDSVEKDYDEVSRGLLDLYRKK